jgi:hypothetical protein
VLFLDRFRLFFSLFFIVSCFDLLFSRDYKALYCIFADFHPVNRLYFWVRKFLRVLACTSSCHICRAGRIVVQKYLKRVGWTRPAVAT